jgi:hypothetical protein
MTKIQNSKLLLKFFATYNLRQKFNIHHSSQKCTKTMFWSLEFRI